MPLHIYATFPLTKEDWNRVNTRQLFYVLPLLTPLDLEIQCHDDSFLSLQVGVDLWADTDDADTSPTHQGDPMSRPGALHRHAQRTLLCRLLVKLCSVQRARRLCSHWYVSTPLCTPDVSTPSLCTPAVYIYIYTLPIHSIVFTRICVKIVCYRIILLVCLLNKM